MTAILKRETRAYFDSLIGYIFLTAFFAGSGILFSVSSLQFGSTDMSGMYSGLFYILLVLIPILTMRTLSEEKRQKTDQLLLTAPVSIPSLVLGKFFAAMLIYSIGVCMTLVYAVVVSFYGVVSWLTVLGNVVGLLLLGAAYVAVGMLISSLTENQVIAAIGGFACMLALFLISAIASIIPVPWIANILTNLSFGERYSPFTYGVFDFSNVLFFVSATVIFLFLTIRVIERRRWS